MTAGPTRKTYGQYCPVADALDVLGDRWTLLIIRELLVGDHRFTDLKDRLRGIAPNLLSERLRELESQGLVVQKELPPPAARTVYSLTAAGRQARGVLQALARFGFDRLPPPSMSEPPRPSSAVHGALEPWHDPRQGVGLHQHYRLMVDGEQFDLAEDDGRLVRPPAGEPDLTLELSAITLYEVRQGRTTLRQAIADGRATVTGPAKVLRDFERLFALAPPKPRARTASSA